MCTYTFQTALPESMESMGEVGVAVGQVGSLEVKIKVCWGGVAWLHPPARTCVLGGSAVGTMSRVRSWTDDRSWLFGL